MISLIIPTYRNPKYLDVCLQSAIDGQTTKNEIIVIVDGYVDESQHIFGLWNHLMGYFCPYTRKRFSVKPLFDATTIT